MRARHPHEPCPGRHCTYFRSCPHHDDCFLYRRSVGLPDMRWDEDSLGPQPPMSCHVRQGLQDLELEVE